MSVFSAILRAFRSKEQQPPARVTTRQTSDFVLERNDLKRSKLEIFITIPQAPLLTAQEERDANKFRLTLYEALRFCRPFDYYCPHEACSEGFLERQRKEPFRTFDATGTISRPVQIETRDKDQPTPTARLYPRFEKNDFLAQETLRVAAKALCVLARNGVTEATVFFPAPYHGRQTIPMFTASNPLDAKATLAQLGEVLAPHFVIEPTDRSCDNLRQLISRRGTNPCYGGGTCSA